MALERGASISRGILRGLGALAAAIAALHLVAFAVAYRQGLAAPIFAETEMITGGPAALAEQLDSALLLFCFFYLVTFLGWLGSWRWHEALVALAALGPLAFIMTALALALGRQTDVSRYDYFVYEIVAALVFLVAAALFAGAARFRFQERDGEVPGSRGD